MTGLKLGNSVDQENHACGCMIESFDSGARKETLCPPHSAAKEARLLCNEVARLRSAVERLAERNDEEVSRLTAAVGELRDVVGHRPSLPARVREFFLGRRSPFYVRLRDFKLPPS